MAMEKQNPQPLPHNESYGTPEQIEEHPWKLTARTERV